MDTDSQTETADGVRAAVGTDLNVVLAYEDFFTGMHALRTFDHLFLLADQHPRLSKHNVWKFDLLEIKKLREIAVTEAATADLVIISAHGPGNLPRGVREWIENWVSVRRNEVGALVMLLDGSSQEGGKRLAVETYLEECARRARMDFFNQKTKWRHGRQTPEMATGSTKTDWQAFEILTQVGPAESGGPQWEDSQLMRSV